MVAQIDEHWVLPQNQKGESGDYDDDLVCQCLRKIC
jgi:hypothetical protein